MNPHEWFVEHRLAFVTRSLEPSEERVFQEHLPACSDCREATARLARDLAWLPMGAMPATPRPGYQRQVLERVLHGGRRRWYWVVPALAAASVLLVLSWGARGTHRAARLAAENQELQTALGATRDTLAIIRDANRVLQASILTDGHQGGITIFADQRTHRWNVVVHGLPTARPDEVYQFWFICSNGMVRGAQIHPDQTRPAFLTLSMPEAGGEVIGAALTLEPMGQTSPEPKGKELAHLML
jgi:hypothetical protein